MEICRTDQGKQREKVSAESLPVKTEGCNGKNVSYSGGDSEECKRLHRAAQNLLAVLKKQNLHVSMAESCTGGMLASSLVDLSGASDVFEEGYVTYSNRVKQKLLGVKPETLERYTAVSSQTAAEMAEGVHARTGVELTMAVTGYAGPDDGEDGTPAGTVYIGIWYGGTVQTRRFHFNGERNSCRRQAAEAALLFGLERIGQSE